MNNHALQIASTLEVHGFWAAGDTMRQLCAANSNALHLLCTVLPFLEDAEDDPCYKDGRVTQLIARLKANIKRLEAEA